MRNLTKLMVALMLVLSLSITGAGAASSDDVTNKGGDSSIKSVIENYYEKSYDIWFDLEPADLSEYLYMDSIQMCNKETVLGRTVERWKYEIQNGYYKGQRERNKLSFNFKDIDISENNATVAVIISPEDKQGAAYPLFVQFGENIFHVVKKDGKWLISGHDYDDVWFYEESKTEKITYDVASLHEMIDKEYSYVPAEMTDTDALDQSILRSNPYDDYSYSASRAVAYANAKCESPNTPFFYYVSGGDCTNFVSQCVSYGFGVTSVYNSSSSYRMVLGATYTSGWYTGSQSWEQVPAHWNYMLSSKTNMNGPRAREGSLSTLSAGDVMQIDFDNDGIYTHSTICVDTNSKKFAQHTYNTFRYYSEYSGTKRFYEPISFREY